MLFPERQSIVVSPGTDDEGCSAGERCSVLNIEMGIMGRGVSASSRVLTLSLSTTQGRIFSLHEWVAQRDSLVRHRIGKGGHENWRQWENNDTCMGGDSGRGIVARFAAGLVGGRGQRTQCQWTQETQLPEKYSVKRRPDCETRYRPLI